MSFSQMLGRGKAGESAIAKWLISRGGMVLPVYEKIINEGKGPQIFGNGVNFISPDMLVFSGKKCQWIEAKHKTAFSWHRITRRWVTGIDIRHYEHYLEVDRLTPWPVWLLFLQKGGQAKDSPEESPAGLFGNPIKYLSANENHRHMNHGRSGMVYWAISHLRVLCSINEIESLLQ